MSKPITVTIAQLRDILARVDHATPFSAITLTDARARVTGNPYGHGGILKLVKVNGFTGANYASSVVRQMVREGVSEPTFQPKPRQWGSRISEALVAKEDSDGQLSFYLPAHLNPTIRPKPLYLVPQPIGLGRHILCAIAKEKVAAWLPKDRTDEAAVAQGIERPVTYRDYRLDSLVTLSILGQRYRIRQPRLLIT